MVVRREDAFLLTLRAKPPGQGVWGLPGGALQLGETALAAAAREVQEETGILCRPLRCFDCVDVVDRAPDGTVQYHFLLAAVMADWQSGEPQADDDARAVRWFTVADLAAITAFPRTAELVRQAFQQKT